MSGTYCRFHSDFDLEQWLTVSQAVVHREIDNIYMARGIFFSKNISSSSIIQRGVQVEECHPTFLLCQLGVRLPQRACVRVLVCDVGKQMTHSSEHHTMGCYALHYLVVLMAHKGAPNTRTPVSSALTSRELVLA